MITNKVFTKNDLATELVDNQLTNITKSEAIHVINDMMQVLSSAFKRGERVTLKGLGTFKVVQRKARPGRNIKTGEQINVPASYTVKFTPGKQLKQALNDDKK